MSKDKKNEVSVFLGYSIRSTQYQGERYFSVVDFVRELTGSPDANRYWSDLKASVNTEENGQPFAFCVPLKLRADDGKLRRTDCATTEGLFRIVQSVPSPKAEPAKRWLAQVAHENVQEKQNPELAIQKGRQRAFDFYTKKGATPEWTKSRIEGIEARTSLTDLFKAAGVSSGAYYAKLTSDTHKGAFGITPSEHKGIKQLHKNERLRDNFVISELALSRMAEAFLAEDIKSKNAKTPKDVEACVKENQVFMKTVRTLRETQTGTRVATAERPIKEIK